jgi:hypothetical protein
VKAKANDRSIEITYSTVFGEGALERHIVEKHTGAP